jgi:ATP-binding cassette subfamily B protein
MDDFISHLPQGYDTPLAKDLDGIDLSGGQKQRIAIARTFFKKSQIMILDEPTSNIDPKAEEEIFENVLQLTRNQILILVSHRFSTVRRADKIIVLESGHLTEQGSHRKLMAHKGTYARLFTLQAKSYQ